MIKIIRVVKITFITGEVTYAIQRYRRRWLFYTSIDYLDLIDMPATQYYRAWNANWCSSSDLSKVRRMFKLIDTPCYTVTPITFSKLEDALDE